MGRTETARDKKRTAAAKGAIKRAWKQEQLLVKEGKGTRDWSPKQQMDILERGKAYDESGKAFEGHHMKSVKGYPGFQGDIGNIQFLSRKEHQAAHRYNFRNITNGYFDPVTEETMEFNSNDYQSCAVMQLSCPVCG